jgi:GNAT superfamily N-acetyltransferase
VTEARIRQAGVDDALVVAALTLQCAIHRGGAPDPGFLDRFARAWARERDSRPVWIAERRGEHAAYVQGALLQPLPRPGRRPGGGTLFIEQFFVRPAHRGEGIGEAVLRAAVDWARAQRLDAVRMTAGPRTRPMCERIGFTGSSELIELRVDRT